MAQRQIVISAPSRVNVWMMPQAGSTKILCFYDSDDPLAINLAAQYAIMEGWIEYAAGAFELNPEVVNLIHSIP